MFSQQGKQPAESLTFIKGGGEMGELIRAYDWSSNILGIPESWPSSLRTTLGIVLHSAFPMFLFWGKDLICFYNDAFRPSLGMNGKHPALGKRGREVWQEIWAFIGPLIDGVMQTGEPVYFEDQSVPFYRNGKMEDIYWTFSYSPAYGDAGTISGVFVTCTETTKKVLQSAHVAEIQAALEQSEQRTRAIIDSASFPIGVYTGSEMQITFANQALLEAWGKGNEVVGKSFYQVLPEMLHQPVARQLQEVWETGKAYHVSNECIEIEKNGSLQPYYFNYSFIPLFDSDGQIYGIVNTGADVTNLNLAKKKLEENEKNFRNTILKAPVAICIFRGPDYIVEIANDRMLELWGTIAEKVLHKPIFEGLPEVRNQGFEDLLYSVYHTGATISMQERPIRLPRNGKIQQEYVSFLYEPEVGATGAIIGVMAVAMIVSDQVKARHQIEELVADRTKELAAANQNLERSNAELSQFAYIASHDLQEPIRKIITYSQLLERALGGLTERPAGYLQKITSAGGRMMILIRDILTYSELSRSAPALEEVNLQNVIREIENELELVIEQKHAQITYSGLPTVKAIPLQMYQLFSNLLSNSLKYCKEDIAPVITITSELVDGQYHIKVADNGIGFEEKHADQIFNIFQRLHNKREFSGTGIGLALCRKITDHHQGSIFATARPGMGATFHVSLPA